MAPSCHKFKGASFYSPYLPMGLYQKTVSQITDRIHAHYYCLNWDMLQITSQSRESGVWAPNSPHNHRQVSDFWPEKRKKKNSIQRLQLEFSISMQTLLLGLLPSCKLLCYELGQLSEITCGAESACSLVCRATIHIPTLYTHSLLVWYLQFTTQPPCAGLVLPLAM